MQQETQQTRPSGGSAASRALKAAAPIMAGYVVLGLPCGILGSAAGMEVWMVAAMSILFYSGAGQYMIPNMWLAANPISAIIASVGLINTRQMLYGASLSQFCGSAGRGLTTLFGATVTDESFGVNYAKFLEGGWDVKTATFVNLFSQSSWILANTAGAIVGAIIAVPTALASFAMTSLFICLLCMQNFSRENLVAIAAAALGVILCKAVGLTGPAILIGALLGVAGGMLATSTLLGGKNKGTAIGGAAPAAADGEPAASVPAAAEPAPAEPAAAEGGDR